ncbi:MAG: TIM barrel protein [Lutisporaceae bacterium]
MKNIFVSSVRDESEQIFKLAEKYDLGIEVLGFIEPYKLNDYNMTIESVKGKLSNIHKRSLHGPFIDLFPGSVDPEIVRVVNNRFLTAYETARKFEAQHIIFHAGYVPKATFPKAWINNSVKFWDNFLSEIKENIEIHIENLCEEDFNIIRELVEAINSSMFSICLDIGHVNVNSSKNLEEWIKGLGDNIKYVHLHNNDGLSDNHWGLCRGNIDILKTLELLELHSPNANWSLETKLDETEESILLLDKYGFIKSEC